MRKQLGLKLTQQRLLGFGLLLLTIAAAFAMAWSAPAPSASVWKKFRLSFVGYGPARIGMTVYQASKALGMPLSLPKNSTQKPNAECYIVWPHGSTQTPISFLITHNRIARIDVLRPPVASVSGATVGTSESLLKQLYRPLEIQPGKYVPKAHTLIYHSQIPIYQAYRMVFETDGKKVTRFRAGYADEVSWVEGCA